MWKKLLDILGLGDPPHIIAAKQRMALDQADPRRRMVCGILAISYEADPAYLGDFASTAIREWYGIDSADLLEQRIREYLDGGIGTPGYDVFRAAFLARAGFGAGMLTEARSWSLAYDAAAVMQRHYQTWQHYGMGYLDGHLEYRRKEGDSEGRRSELRQNLLFRMGECMKGRGAWQVPFSTAMTLEAVADQRAS